MNCTESKRELELMRESNSGALLVHLRRCADCRDYAETLRISRLLRTLPAPEPDADFERRVLAAALPQRAQVSRRTLRGWQLATAASLLLAIFLALPRGPHAVPAATLATSVALPVSVSVDTPRALPGALISVSMPEGVQLDGYGDTRELQWHADLRAGSNRLTLPLHSSGAAAAGAQILIQVEHNGARREFRVPVRFGRGAAAPADSPQMI
ncbi:hypothetical protein [Microbulbifer sp. SAOS-129_SWC]|uniref:hypothetical protein n=1 Tax=Microbulbifer sp. SAOS-129_SWC TaxID=3145235 RepID=UPI0032162DAE